MDINANSSEILKNEILLLIMDYLYSSNYINSLITMEQETKTSIFTYNKELSFLRKLIIQGNWKEAENFIFPLKTNTIFDFTSAMYTLKLQKFFEATETDSINYDQKEIELQLKDIRNYSTEEQFKDLLNLLNKNSIKDEPKYKNWTINGGRLKTFEIIRELLGVIYPINKEKEKNIKDNLLIKFFLKIIGKGKIQKNILINEIISIINNKNFNINNNINQKNNFSQNDNYNNYGSNKLLKNNNNNFENQKKEDDDEEEDNNENNRINNIKKDEFLDKKKNNIKEKQQEKARPQSSTRMKNKKIEIDSSSNNNDKRQNKNKNKNINLNKDNINQKNNENNDNIYPNNQINNNQIENNNFENTNISNIPNCTETSSLIKDTKKIITNLSETNPKNKKIKKKEVETILEPNKIHQKIESPYDLYSYDPSSFSMDSLIVDSHAIRAISFSPNGKILSIGTNSKSLKLYDFSPINEKFLRHNNSSSDDFISLKLLFEKPNHHAGSIYCLDFSPNDKLIATGSNDKMIKIFVIPDFSNKMTEILELAIPDQKGTVRSVIFPPTEDNFFFSGGMGDSNIYMWDTESGKKINSLLGHENNSENSTNVSAINSLKFSVDENAQDKLLGSCANDNYICFHDYRTNNPVKKFLVKNHGEINDITFSNDFICSVHNDGYICLYNNSNMTQNVVKELKASNKELRSVNFSKDGKFLMTASFDNKINIFDMNDDLKLVKSLEHDDRAVNCRWHPDKPIIVTSSADKTARIWSPKIY